MSQTRLNREQLNLHHRAMKLGQRHRKVEAELCACLREADSIKLHRKLGFSSVFSYATQALELSESVAYAFITVARKSREVPELKKAIEERRLSISKASRIVSVLNNECASRSTTDGAQDNLTQSELSDGGPSEGVQRSGAQRETAESLIAFASTHTCREIDKKVASLRPEKAKRDRIRPVGKDQFEIRAHVSKEVHEKLERLTDILATNGQPTDFESVLDFALEAALDRKDPLRKAERAMERKAKRLCLRKANEEEIETPRQKESTGQEHQVVVGHKKEELPGQSLASKEIQSDSTSAATAATAASSAKRTPIPAEVKHEVIHRDGARCTHMNERGERCTETRWLELHHLKAVSLGGTHEVSNLTTLCSAHHDLVHQLSFPIDGQISWVRERQLPYRAS